MGFITNLLQNISRYRDFLWRAALILVVVFFLAKTINTLLAHFYFPLEVPSRSAFQKTGAPLQDEPQVSLQSIISRNIFNSEANSGKNLPNNSLEGPLFPSTLGVELMGTMVFRNSRFSVALIKDRANNKAEYYGVGEQLQSATIAKIERFRVIVENNGRLETIELKAAESKLQMSSPVAPQGRPQTSVATDLEEIGPNRFVVPQSLLDDTLNNFSKVLTQARMVPNLTDDNRTDGFKVFQIKQGSIYEKLGLRDNDIIKRVNGQDLDSFEKATGLFTALRNEKTISMDVVRNGSRLNLSYEIR